MVQLLWIGIGGCIGSVLRHIMTSFIITNSKTLLPLGTLSVNLLGSFLIGLLWGLSEKSLFSMNIRLFLFVGILGGFTTFSSFTMENFNLIRQNEIKTVLIYVLASNILGILMVFFGYFLSQQILNFTNK